MDATNARKRLMALDAVIRAQQQELNKTRKRMRNERRKEDRLRKHILDVCFVLFVWCAPSASLALAFATHAASTKGCDMAVCSQELEERYLGTDMDVLTAINDRVGGMSKNALADARRFERENALFHWIQTHNDTKSVAPNTTMIRKQLLRNKVEPVATSAQCSAVVGHSVSVKWVQRFRKRWALRRGRFMPGERLTRDQIGTKAILSKRTRPPLWAIPPRTLCFVMDQKGGAPDGPQTGTTRSFPDKMGSLFWPPVPGHFFSQMGSK